MELTQFTNMIADILKEYDGEFPIHKNFQSGIGPFGEPQLVQLIAERLSARGVSAETKRTPDMAVGSETAVEFKIARPFGDNGKPAENWSVNLLHPYEGNTSLVGDAMKLSGLAGYSQKVLFVIGYEHNPPKISLDPLFDSFEAIMKEVIRIGISERCEETRLALVHPEHQTLRCLSWQLL